MEPCPKPAPPEGGTNGDLLDYAIAATIDLAECNARMGILRQWRAEHEAMGKGD